MTELTRRTALYGLAAGSVAALAGCTGAGDPVQGGNGSDGNDESGGTDGGDETDGGDGDGTGGGDGGDETDGSDGGSDGGEDVDGDVEAGVATAVHQVGEALSGPAWDRTQRRGICALITESDGDNAWILDEAPEAAREFVEETEFAESVVCYVESVGPTTCHDAIAFDGVGVEGGTLVADATVQGAEDEDVACGEAITYSAALLRVTSDPRPETARLSVTDGSGETGAVRNGDGVPDR